MLGLKERLAKALGSEIAGGPMHDSNDKQAGDGVCYSLVGLACRAHSGRAG